MGSVKEEEKEGSRDDSSTADVIMTFLIISYPCGELCPILSEGTCIVQPHSVKLGNNL